MHFKTTLRHTDVLHICTTGRHSNVWNGTLRKCTMRLPNNLLQVVISEEDIVAACSYSCNLVVHKVNKKMHLSSP